MSSMQTLGHPSKVPLASIVDKQLPEPEFSTRNTSSGGGGGNSSSLYTLISADLPSKDAMLTCIRGLPHPLDPSALLVHPFPLAQGTDIPTRRRRLMSSEAHMKARILSWALDPVGDCAFTKGALNYAYELEADPVQQPVRGKTWPDFCLTGIEFPYVVEPAIPMLGEAKLPHVLNYVSEQTDLVAAYRSGVPDVRKAVNQTLGYAENQNECNTAFLTTLNRTWFMHKDPQDNKKYIVYRPIRHSSTDPSLILAHIYFAKRAIFDFDPPAQPAPPAFSEHVSTVQQGGQPTPSGSSGPATSGQPQHGLGQQSPEQEQAEKRQRLDGNQQQQQQQQAAPATSSSESSPAYVSQSPISTQAAPSSHDSPMTEAQPTNSNRVVPSSCLELSDGFLSVGDNSSVKEGRFMGQDVVVKCGLRHHGVNTDIAEDQYSLVEQEAAVYDVLQPIQGSFIPCMLAHGVNEKDPNEYMLVLERLPGQHPSPDRPELRSPSMLEKGTEALKAIHAQGIFHSDIRSANILIDEQQQRVYICDLGFSRRYADYRVSMEEWGALQEIELQVLHRVFVHANF